MNESGILNKMADIELPAPPDWQPLVIALCVGLAIVLVICLMIWRNARARKAQEPLSPARARPGTVVLAELEERWSNGEVTDREASYQLSTLLRLGLGLPQLGVACPAIITSDAAAWEKMIQCFNQLRYRKTTSATLSPEDFNNIKKWLTPTAIDGQQAC